MSAQNDSRQQLGDAGERLAEEFLKDRGFKPIARRFSTPVGELDLIMRDRDTLVFVEVKTRRDRIFSDPQDAVRLGKQRRMTRAARWFIHRKRLEDRPCRFDIVAVVLPETGQPEIEHFPAAFVPRSQ